MTAREHRLVADFADAFGHPAHTTRTFPTLRLRELRVRLIREEYDELAAAAAADDIVDIADGIADIAYIAHGTLHAYGMTYRPYAAIELVGVGNAMTSYLAAEDQYLLAVPPVDADNPAALGYDTVIEGWLNRVLVEVRFTARQLGIPFPAVFTEVHASNMRKLGEDGRPVYRADGKVGKPVGWAGPNIVSILAAHNTDRVTSNRVPA